jgi:type III pantothenate kinase
MILLLDAGNTRIKWGVRQTGEWLSRGACPTRDAAQLRTDLAAFPLRRALLCCVANEATRAALDSLLAPRLEQLVWLTAEADAHGLRNAYQPPESLGADRYAALVAAARRGLGACVVASVGTALTADALTAEGQFLGGAIAPGPDLMQAALLRGTARVRDFSGRVTGFPVDTGAAVASGIALAQAGVVAGMRERLARHGGTSVTVLLTGGARAVLANLLEPPVVDADDLVLEGLAWIAKDREWDD